MAFEIANVKENKVVPTRFNNTEIVIHIPRHTVSEWWKLYWLLKNE